MMRAPFHTRLLPAAALMLTACSISTDAPEQRQSAAPKIFSVEEKRIARALSIGGNDIDASAAPQYQATLCSLALAAINDRLRNSGALSAEQQQALRQAQAHFQRRSTTGLSLEERSQTRKEVETAYPEPADRARFAIGCLRDLA